MCRVASAPNPVEMPYAGVGAAASSSTTARARSIAARAASREHHRRPVAGDGHDVLGRERADVDGDRGRTGGGGCGGEGGHGPIQTRAPGADQSGRPVNVSDLRLSGLSPTTCRERRHLAGRAVVQSPGDRHRRPRRRGRRTAPVGDARSEHPGPGVDRGDGARPGVPDPRAARSRGADPRPGGSGRGRADGRRDGRAGAVGNRDRPPRGAAGAARRPGRRRGPRVARGDVRLGRCCWRSGSAWPALAAASTNVASGRVVIGWFPAAPPRPGDGHPADGPAAGRRHRRRDHGGRRRPPRAVRRAVGAGRRLRAGGGARRAGGLDPPRPAAGADRGTEPLPRRPLPRPRSTGSRCCWSCRSSSCGPSPWSGWSRTGAGRPRAAGGLVAGRPGGRGTRPDRCRPAFRRGGQPDAAAALGHGRGGRDHGRCSARRPGWTWRSPYPSSSWPPR